MHFFRIVQELINNSVRHGKAKNSSINFSVENSKLLFKYTDNGTGFDNKDRNHKKGLGMKNIESRVALLEGKFSVDTAKNKGFKIEIII